MSSATLQSLHDTLRQVRRRRNRLYVLYHGSMLGGAALLLTLLLSLPAALLDLAGLFQGLLSVLWLAGMAALARVGYQRLQTLRSNDRQLAQYIDEHIPDLEQRLLTSLEFGDEAGRAGVSEAFVGQLLEDAREHVSLEKDRIERVAFTRNAPVAALSAVAVLLVTAGLFLMSDNLMRSGGVLLWPFPQRDAGVELATLPEPAQIEISVEPGDRRLQRGEALDIVARIRNADPADVTLRMRGDNVNWQDAGMTRAGGNSEESVFRYELPVVREDLTYYVSFDDGARQSREFTVTVFDLPRVEQIDVDFAYPAYTGREDQTEEDGGDMVVPEGTEVALQVHFNKPVREAALEFGEPGSDQHRVLPLEVDADRGTARFRVDEDAVYRVTATDREQLTIEQPLDYYIRAIEDQPPELALRSPGADEEVMPLEEVLLEVDASDDYGLRDFRLHYTVIGRDEQTIDFLGGAGETAQRQQVRGSEWLYLEELDVAPGDFISYYMTLTDNNAVDGPQQITSDIYFLQITPTDALYREAGGGGQGGAGGQGGGQDSALVTLQKDIIAATWKLRNQVDSMEGQQFSDDVAVLAQSQRDAVERARMSIDRLSERLDFADDSFARAVASLEQAIVQMEDAASALDQEQVTRALQPEQQALQHIMRSEAAINQTDVSFQRTAGGGGGGGGQQENADLRELFEMEMGQNENRYETPERAGGQQAQSEEASRLEELARRQEALSQAQRNLSRRMEDMSEEQQRRELERLRREQERLRTELEQMQRQMAQRQGGQPGSPGGQQGAQSATQELQRAMEQMEEAAQAQTPAQAAARGQRALDTLRNQQRAMEEEARQSGSVNQLASNASQQGRELARQQRQLQQTLDGLAREQGLGQNRQSARADERVQQLIDQQERQQEQLRELDSMLRALLARGGEEDRALLNLAQRASRQLQPLRNEMDNSNRALNSGMVNLSSDMERDIRDGLADLESTLQQMDPGQSGQREGGRSPAMQAAEEATALRERIESLREQAQERGGAQQGGGVGPLRDMLEESRQLARQLTDTLQQQAQQQSGEGRSGRPGGQRGEARVAGGGIPEQGEALALGNARSIRSEITRQDLEAFLNQPELLEELLQPLVELEAALRSRAEQEQIEERLFALGEDEVPEEYQRLVEAYYRALSDSSTDPGGSAEDAQ